MAKTFRGFPPIQVLLSQKTPDDFFTHNKEDSKIKDDKDFCLKVRNTRNCCF